MKNTFDQRIIKFYVFIKKVSYYVIFKYKEGTKWEGERYRTRESLIGLLERPCFCLHSFFGVRDF